MFENRHFIVFDVSELNKIDFTQVLETNSNTVRKSYDNTQTFVKWDGATPSCIDDLTTKQGPYNYTNMLILLSTETWVGPTGGTGSN